MPTPTPAPPSNGIVQRLGWPAIALATVLAVLAAGLVLVLAGGGDDDQAATTTDTLQLRPADEVDTGDPLAIEFTTVDGGTTTLADELDGPTVVNFFASWCTPCVNEMPEFEQAAQRLDGKVAVYGLAVTDRPEDVARIVERTGISYGYGRDVRGDVAGAAGVVQMPTTFLVDADGTIVVTHPGALDLDGILDLVEEHLGVTA